MFELLVVNFHYFRSQTYASGIYPVTPDQFRFQINTLGKQYKFIGQIRLCDWINKQQYPEGKYCIITFDDGLKEQMEAYKWLSKKAIPAIFFIPTKPIIEKCVLNVHKLHYIRTLWSDEKILNEIKHQFGQNALDIDMAAAQTQYRYDNELAQQVKYIMNFSLKEKQKTSFIQSCFIELVKDENAFSQQLYMSDNDIKELASLDMLGSHSHAHIPLAQADDITTTEDINRSIEYLENIGSKKIVSFSYPYGSNTAVNEHTSAYLSKTGVRFAFTMRRGINNNTNMKHPFLLNRMDTNDAPGGKNI